MDGEVRVQPHNLEAERSVLGAVMIDPSTFPLAMAVLRPEMFFRKGHEHAYRHLVEMSENGKPPDLVLLKNSLEASGLLEEAGGPAYLAGLLDGVPRSTNVEHYAQIVKEKARLRGLIGSGVKLIEAAYAEQYSARELAGSMADALIESVGAIDDGMRTVGEVAASYVSGLDTAAKPIPTGFCDVDTMLRGGLRPGEFVIVAARPSVGKTSMVLGICRHFATLGLRGPFFSLEMSKQRVVARLIAWESGVPTDKIERNTATSDEFGAVSRAVETLSDLPLLIESSASSATEIVAWCRRAKQMEGGIAYAAVDYMQLCGGLDPRIDATREMAWISRTFKRLAEELGIPVIGLSQLSRAPEARRDKRPQLSDLRASGALEQDADIVILPFREEMHNPKPENTGIAEVIVAKNRDGATGVIKLAFVKELAQFRNFARSDF